jgi:hypothetical protein
MFTLGVRKLFRKSILSWQTATPPRRKPPPLFRPGLEVLEDRCCPSGGVPDAPTSTSLFWDPALGNNSASTASNWDKGFLGGPKAMSAPGDAANELDTINFDGTGGQQGRGNQNCNWNYKPLSVLGAVNFQNGYNKTVSFTTNGSFSVQGGGKVTTSAAPTIAPNGSSGVNTRPAITLTNGSWFYVSFNSSLTLQGFSSGNAIFMAGDGTPGEFLGTFGTVSYSGVGSVTGTANTDYLKIPVHNSGIFKVNGDGNGTSVLGAVLQVSGTDANTSNVSFSQNNSGGETDLSNNGTLWCYNNFTMTRGLLQTMDAFVETLEVGTASNDGIANLLGGTVNIDDTPDSYGVLNIAGSTKADNPTVNVGIATFNFNLNLTTGSSQCSELIVGNGSSGGTLNFGAGGGTATVNFNGWGKGDGGNVWLPIWFSSVTKTTFVTFSPGFTEKWIPTRLQVSL